MDLTGPDSPRTWLEDTMYPVAEEADIIIYCGGIDLSIEAEAKDRNTIVWPEKQLELIEQLSTLGKQLIVVQLGGGQLDDSSLLSNKDINTLLWAGYPSQDGGTAIFDIITGAAAPAGRLPVTQHPAEYVNQVPMTDMTLRPSATNPGRTYRWYNDAVLEFGYGLHYTTFSVSWAGTLKPELPPPVYNTETLLAEAAPKNQNEPLDTAPFSTFTINVKNTGKLTSDYVALLFPITTDAGPAPYPRKMLVSYARIAGIKPGETRAVDLEVTLGSVARTDRNGNLVLYPGSYTLQVVLEGERFPARRFEVLGRRVVLDQFPKRLEEG